MKQSLTQLDKQVLQCTRCPRLVAHRERVAVEKRAAYIDQTYHGKPLPNFGDGRAKLLIVGLAPGAHGANRTGRMFTGDRSGDFLFEALHRAGLANQAESKHVGDGLSMRGALITAACRCAPPGNKPLPEEMKNCEPWLDATFDAIKPRALLCLGGIALKATLAMYQRRGWIKSMSPYRFGHGKRHDIDGAPTVVCCYHPSQQNTFTGRLTMDMLVKVIEQARDVAAGQ